MPGPSIIKIRENLRNALRSIRDERSDCWLWIDAICIRQSSNEERNHQIKLMAKIYRKANVVLVWLQSANEDADVGTAFDFVRTAVAHDTTDRSVFNYIQAHFRTSRSTWNAVKRLCQLRYWTRKWIIQELVMARSVVLQTGDSQCSMLEFEKFCGQLQTHRDRHAYYDATAGSSSETRETLEFGRKLVSSPAARLVLQRSAETRGEQQPRLLTNSSSATPTALVGKHRRHLSVDYAAEPVERFAAVLHFAVTHDHLLPAKVLAFASLLMKLLGVTQGTVRRRSAQLENFPLVVPATILGAVTLQPESVASIALRTRIEPLQPMRTLTFDTRPEVWELTTVGGPVGAEELVGRPDMAFFSIIEYALQGLAACRLESNDAIWHFPTTQLVFAVRILPGHRAMIIGRAYLFSATTRPGDPLNFWLTQPSSYNAVRGGAQHISAHWAQILALGWSGLSAQELKVSPQLAPEPGLPTHPLETLEGVRTRAGPPAIQCLKVLGIGLGIVISAPFILVGGAVALAVSVAGAGGGTEVMWVLGGIVGVIVVGTVVGVVCGGCC
ncbi:hypothetical protein LTR73_006123 [Friedmanniomyces endolithicus]|nr:hypothetical protein LTR73_006123 [Friedmanniomyces endolithicus]